MGNLLDFYMKFVPTLRCEQHVSLPNGSVIDTDNTQFFSTLFGGDQLTVARIRGTQALRDTHDSAIDCCEALSLLWKTGILA